MKINIMLDQKIEIVELDESQLSLVETYVIVL
jgi:hypothetical protein